MTKQLHKLVHVIKIRDLEPEETVARELALFKISCQDGDARAQVMQFTEIFRGKTVDVSKRSVTVEITGTDDKIEAFEKHGPPVRPDRADPHRRDRRGARAQHHVATGRQASRLRRPGRARELVQLVADVGASSSASGPASRSA